MDPSQLELKDIHLPEAIGWWPPAIGWWILPILIPLAIALIIWLYELFSCQTAIKSAKKQLQYIKQQNQMAAQPRIALLSELIRRTAISSSPRHESAGLTGETWLKYLDQSVQGSPFSQGVGQHLVDTHYKKTVEDDINITELITLCETWLKAQTKKRK